jgi:hypothetical protein
VGEDKAMEDTPINQELKTIDCKPMIAVLPEMKFSVKQFKEMLKIAENLYGINNENVISLRAFTTEKETILQKTQTQGFITKRDFHSFFDSDRLKKIGSKIKVDLDKAEQAGKN